MRRNTLVRHICFIVATFIATMVLFALNRAIFLAYNHSLAAGATLAEYLRCMLHALKLDASVAGYVTALPLLVTLCATWGRASQRKASIYGWLLILYFGVVSAIIAIVECADIGMFAEWQRRIDSQIFIYTPREMLASVSLLNGIYATLYIVATIALAISLYRIIIGRLFTTATAPRAIERIAHSFVLLLLGGLLFVAIRGGVGTATANLSKAYFSSNMFLNQAAVNPLFSLIDSSLSGDNLDEYDTLSAEQVATTMAKLSAKHDAEGEAWLNTTRPHIVLLIVEGMGRTITDATIDGEAVMPNIRRLGGEGVWFDRLYASSFRTDRGTVATLSGFPAQPKMSIMKYPAKAANLAGLAQPLAEAGYATRFIYGGDANFTNTRAYLYATGYEEVDDETNTAFEGHRSKWGYADDVLLEYAAAAIIERMDSGIRSFDTILTLSSHEPFEVPYSRFEDVRLNAFAFTDAAIGSFIEQLRATPHWADTLVVIIPDHGFPYPENIGGNSPERHHIPMLWIGGAVRSPRIVDSYASQSDFAATLLAALSLPHDSFPLSRNIATASREFGYWTFNNGFGVIDNSGATLYDCDREVFISTNSDTPEQHILIGKTLLQTTFAEIKSL